MEALLGSKNNGGGKAADLARLLVFEAAMEVQRSLVGLTALKLGVVYAVDVLWMMIHLVSLGT
ncbi:hypothetical protein PR202_gb06437 [Eleusine coracana subsp. coracana]|uniref:Uncharacterized protein n=1 Tax=Eleusine coracana subsp. coracana TaxID=191504 RepID=A0AAV5E9L6_ELECO|nr:hypothetical protein PR202_gb06437 [Eleusine coracana subsp. coracana]